MSKRRNTKEDIPRRIYKETLERINKHLHKRMKPVKNGVRKEVKGDFNQFLILLVDTYEHLLNAKAFYATKLHEDVSEARGEAILISKKSKEPVLWPKQVIILGDDEL